MSEIKIPVDWIRKKEIKLILGDGFKSGEVYGTLSHTQASDMNDSAWPKCDACFITSFADRENTGEQPVSDWVPVDCVFEVRDKSGVLASVLNWGLLESAVDNIKKYKPNIEALYEIYLSETKKEDVWGKERAEGAIHYIKTIDTRVYKTIKGKLVYSNPNGEEWRNCYSYNVEQLTDTNVFTPITTKEINLTEQNKVNDYLERNKKYFDDVDAWSTGTKKSSFTNRYGDDAAFKLTKDGIGKEFETEKGMVFEVCLVGGLNAVIQNGSTGFLTCSLIGEIDGSKHKLVKRHEPRWWIKDLPDADLIKGKWICFDRRGPWHSFESEPSNGNLTFYVEEGFSYNMNCVKNMPKLNDEEWKLSKISIDELRELQRVNNG